MVTYDTARGLLLKHTSVFMAPSGIKHDMIYAMATVHFMGCTTVISVDKRVMHMSCHSLTQSLHICWYPRWILRGCRLYVIVGYPNSRSTQIRSRLLLRSTTPGSNNRLEIESIVSYDQEAGRRSDILPALPDPDSDPDPAAVAAAREHRRGLTCCVFVPWTEVSSSALNLPPSKMDVWMPG